MAVLNFPSNPNINDIYEANGIKYRWTGNRWVIVPNDTSKKLDDTFAVFKDVGNALPPEPSLDFEGNTVPQTVTYTRSFLQGSVRITQHLSKDHTGEEVLIYETKETL